MADPVATTMRGFTAAVAHVVDETAHVQAGGISLGLEGDGADRRFKIMLRHADGTALVVWLTDPGMGRFADLFVDLYTRDAPPAPPGPQDTVH